MKSCVVHTDSDAKTAQNAEKRDELIKRQNARILEAQHLRNMSMDNVLSYSILGGGLFYSEGGGEASFQNSNFFSSPHPLHFS